MKITICVVSFLFLATAPYLFAQIPGDVCDQECSKIAKGLIKQEKTGVYTTWLEKDNYQLGDKVAIAIRKIFSRKRLRYSKNIKAILPIVRKSFFDLTMIPEERYRKPKLSLTLLEELRQATSDESLKEEIAKTIAELEKL